MSGICIVGSTNQGHAELNRVRTKRLLDGELLRIFKALAQIRCSVSVEGLDVELFAVISNFVKNPGMAEVISGEYVHAMPDIIHEANPELARLNLALGDEVVKHPVRFITEYCSYPEVLARQVVATNGPCACYMLDGDVSLYSDDWQGETIPPRVSFLPEDVSAVKNCGVCYLRMRSKYFQPIVNQWQAFQRYRAAEGDKRKTAKEVVDEVEYQLVAAEHDNVPVIFIPMDVESCVIGSHHGAIIFEEIVDELLRRQIPLIGPKAAFDMLEPLAIAADRPHNDVPNMKYFRHDNQLEFKRLLTDFARLVGVPENPALRKLALVSFGSDGLVVCKFAVTARTTLDADLGPLVFGGEYQDILAVQVAALRHFTRGEDFREKMAGLVKQNSDSYLFRAMLLWAENNVI